MYVADSESNIIRSIELTGDDRQVRTLVGGDLFKFGDADGRGDDVRLQHPLGIFFHDGALLIADTYNHKIKQLDPAKRAVKTFAGAGKPGQADGASSSFYEPGGLSVANNKLYVADTNNHAVRVVDLKTKQASTLMIRGLRPPEAGDATTTGAETSDATGPNAEEMKLPAQRLRADGDGALVIDVSLPAGYHLNDAAPQRYRLSIENGAEYLAFEGDAKTIARSAKDLRLPLRLPLRTRAAGAAELRVQLTLFYCREDNTGTCKIKTLVWRAPVEVTNEASAPREIKAQGTIKG